MNLREKLSLTGANCTLPLIERVAIIDAEKAKVKQIADAFGCPVEDYAEMTAAEIAEEVLTIIEKPARPDTLYAEFGGPEYFWRKFGSKEKLVEFLTPFRKAR